MPLDEKTKREITEAIASLESVIGEDHSLTRILLEAVARQQLTKAHDVKHLTKAIKKKKHDPQYYEEKWTAKVQYARDLEAWEREQALLQQQADAASGGDVAAPATADNAAAAAGESGAAPTPHSQPTEVGEQPASEQDESIIVPPPPPPEELEDVDPVDAAALMNELRRGQYGIAAKTSALLKAGNLGSLQRIAQLDSHNAFYEAVQATASHVPNSRALTRVQARKLFQAAQDHVSESTDLRWDEEEYYDEDGNLVSAGQLAIQAADEDDEQPAPPPPPPLADESDEPAQTESPVSSHVDSNDAESIPASPAVPAKIEQLPPPPPADLPKPVELPPNDNNESTEEAGESGGDLMSSIALGARLKPKKEPSKKKKLLMWCQNRVHPHRDQLQVKVGFPKNFSKAWKSGKVRTKFAEVDWA